MTASSHTAWRPIRVLRKGSSISVVRRTLVASALLAFLVASSVALLIVSVSSLQRTTNAENRSKDVTATTLGLEKLVIDLETGLRGFVLTGNERFLDPWRQARAQLPGAIKSLRKLVADDPAQARRTRALTAAISDYVDDYAAPLVEIARISPAAARQPIANAEGKRRTDAIRDQFSRLIAVEIARGQARAESADQQASKAIVLGVLTLAASALLALLFGAYLARAIARPVRDAAAGATRIAAGDLATRLPEHGPGEIGELERAFNSMAGSLEQSRQDLVTQNERLRESERMKSELISIVSHELRTPLASVLGYARLLRQRLVDEESRGRYLEIIDGEARRLAALVDDFLDADRLAHGRLDLVDEVLDMGAVVKDQARLFAGQSGDHRIQVTLADEPLEVQGDPARLAQVVGNLLSNAIKYSPDGGTVSVSGERDGLLVRVAIRDEGVGISDEHRSRVFTKFFRGGATASGIPGTGLGLAVARDIVEAHGGRIGFSTAEGTGSTFWLELRAAG